MTPRRLGGRIPLILLSVAALDAAREGQAGGRQERGQDHES